jgi:cytochrome c oxidase assembly factor CtaG
MIISVWRTQVTSFIARAKLLYLNFWNGCLLINDTLNVLRNSTPLLHCIQCLKHISNKKFWEELIAYFPLIRHGQHRKRCVQKFYCCVCIRCRGNVYTEPLPTNYREYTHKHTDWLEVLMKYTVEMGSCVMLYVRSFIKIGSAIRKFMSKGDSHIQRHTVRMVIS